MSTVVHLLGFGPGPPSGPHLHRSGRADRWWSGPTGLVWTWKEHLWVQRNDHQVFALQMPVDDVFFSGKAEVIIRNKAGDFRLCSKGTLTPLAPEVSPKAMGFQQSTFALTSPSQQVTVWTSSGWVYRQTDNRADAIGLIRPHETLTVGPLGATLKGDDTHWTHVASPIHALTPLHAPLLRDDWGVRWSTEGRQVRGLDDSGRLCTLLTSSGRLVSCEQAALALDGDKTLLDLNTSVIRRKSQVLLDGVQELFIDDKQPAPLHSDQLAGPGGQLWDLRTARPQSERPVFQYGPVVRCGLGWLHLHWESGEVQLVDSSGVLIQNGASLPLDDEDWIDRVQPNKQGELIAITGEGLALPTGLFAPASSRSTVVPASLFTLRFARSVHVNGRTFAWDPAGALLSWPHQPAV